MSPLDVLIGVISIMTLIVMLRNLGVSGNIIDSVVRRDCSEERIQIQGKTVEPVVYIADLPSKDNSNSLGIRLSSIIRHSGLNATLAYTLIRSDKSELLRRVEKDIERTRLAHEATKNPKYAERLRVLSRLYSDIARTLKPYTGSTILIVWKDENVSYEEIRAVKTLIEAETGLKFRRHRRGVLDALGSTTSIVASKPPHLDPLLVDRAGENSIVLGREPEYDALVTLDWPKDFETHIGIIGPTGRGKTVLMLGIIVQLSMLPDTLKPPSVIVFDPKGDLKRLLDRAPLDTYPLKDVALPCVERGLYVVDDGLEHEVLTAVLSCVHKGRNEHKIVVVMDEAWRYIEEASDYIVSSVRQGRSLGLHIVYATQSFDDIPEIVLDNTGTLIIFGGHSKGYAEKASRFGLNVETLNYLPIGTAILRRNSQNLTVQVFNFESYLK